MNKTSARAHDPSQVSSSPHQKSEPSFTQTMGNAAAQEQLQSSGESGGAASEWLPGVDGASMPWLDGTAFDSQWQGDDQDYASDGFAFGEFEGAQAGYGAYTVEDWNRLVSNISTELGSVYVALEGLSNSKGIESALKALPGLKKFIGVLKSNKTQQIVGKAGAYATVITSMIAVTQAATSKGFGAALITLNDCLLDAGVHAAMNSNPWTAAIDLALTVSFGADWPSKGFKHQGPLANDITAALERREANQAQREKEAFWASGSPEAKAEMERLKLEQGLTTIRDYDFMVQIPPIAGKQRPKTLHIYKLVLGLLRHDALLLPRETGEYGLQGYIQKAILRNAGLHADLYGQDGLVDKSVLERLVPTIIDCGEMHSYYAAHKRQGKVAPRIIGIEGSMLGGVSK